MSSHRTRRPLAATLALAAAAPLIVAAGAAAAPGAGRPATPEELKDSVQERAAARVAAAAGRTASAAAAVPAGGAGNGVYQVYVEENVGLGVGTFTVLTGPDHPAGEGLDVLFGDGIPGTSYMIVRDVATETDYVQGQLLTHPDEVSLDDYAPEVEPLGATGFRTTWLGGWITQDVVVHGATPADSTVEVTTTVDGGSEYQIQYLWDVALGEDDGPALQTQTATTELRPLDPLTTTEHALDVADDSLAVVDNDGNTAPPNLAVGVTAGGPGWVAPAPVRPDSVEYVCWPQAIFAPATEYEIDPDLDVSTPASPCTGPFGTNDSAILSVWSVDGTTGPVSVSASLFASPRVPRTTTLRAAPVLLRVPPFRATLTDAGKPIPGRTVAFSVGNTVRCTATTNAAGVASCGTLGDGLAATLALGYSASYAGNAIWAPVSARGPLL